MSVALPPRTWAPPGRVAGWSGGWSVRLAALTYLTVLLIVPLAAILHDGLRGGLVALWRAIMLPPAWHALRLTVWTGMVMAVINGIMGTLTAYVLVRYAFRGKSALNVLIDLPLAIPTLVTGVMLVVLYGPQRALGAWLAQEVGLRVIFAAPGIILALLFITFPFVVRAVQPVLESLEREQEEAAATCGAGSWTIFRRVIFPAVAAPIASGTLLSFARAVGEFGAIIIVAGNIPLRTQTAAVYVLGEIESENQRGASAVSLALLLIAFLLIVLVELLQRRGRLERM